MKSSSPPHHTPTQPRLLPRIWSWVVGRDTKQKIRLLRTSLVFACYCVIAFLAWIGVQSPKLAFDPTLVKLAAAWSLSGAALFMLMIRSSFNLRFKSDPSLTFIQILFAYSVGSFYFALSGPLRSAGLVNLIVILTFGMFSLRAHQLRILTIVPVAIAAIGLPCLHFFAPHKFPADQELVHFVMILVVMPLTSILATQLASLRDKLLKQKNTLKDALTRIEQLAKKDNLTQIYNRRHMQEALQQWKELQTNQSTFAVALLDIDHFKSINDTYGHGIGDMVLKGFARQLQQTLPPPYIVSRWGGEEFLILAPEGESPSLVKSIELLRTGLQRRPLVSELPDLNVTFSAGIAVHRGQRETIEATLARADAAMYRVKATGRNNLHLASRYEDSTQVSD